MISEFPRYLVSSLAIITPAIILGIALDEGIYNLQEKYKTHVEPSFIRHLLFGLLQLISIITISFLFEKATQMSNYTNLYGIAVIAAILYGTQSNMISNFDKLL